MYRFSCCFIFLSALLLFWRLLLGKYMSLWTQVVPFRQIKWPHCFSFCFLFSHVLRIIMILWPVFFSAHLWVSLTHAWSDWEDTEVNMFADGMHPQLGQKERQVTCLFRILLSPLLSPSVELPLPPSRIKNPASLPKFKHLSWFVSTAVQLAGLQCLSCLVNLCTNKSINFPEICAGPAKPHYIGTKLHPKNSLAQWSTRNSIFYCFYPFVWSSFLVFTRKCIFSTTIREQNGFVLVHCPQKWPINSLQENYKNNTIFHHWTSFYSESIEIPVFLYTSLWLSIQCKINVQCQRAFVLMPSVPNE